MAHGLNSIIKREIDCVHHNSISVINKSSSLVGNSATALAAATAASLTVQQPTATSGTGGNSNNNNTSGSASHSGAGNARMGSRRIFTPQFKLQVLESYRIDIECKGNQRATARKYGIHRRQIQKWLQSENSLRESAANCNNQNSVKHHQFHNISHHQMTVSAVASTTTTSSAIGATVATATTTPGRPSVNTHTMSGAYVHNNNNNNNTLHHHRHNQHHQPTPPQSQPPYKTALDTARHSVALVPSPPTAAPATVRLNSAPTKCMNGLPLTPATVQTNTMSMLPTAYSQTPAIKPVPLIQRQHQSPLHQHHHHPQHHQLHQHHHQQQPRQHESVLMSSACLPDSEYSPMGAMQAHYENLHRPQAVYDYIRPYPHPPPAPPAAVVVVPPPLGAPIDLSVGPKRPQCESAKSPSAEAKWYQPPETNNNNEHEILRVKIEPMSPIACSTPNPTQAVDLTCRKRANYTTDPTTPPEKLPKTEDDASAEAPKPVKLFKPYLPDNEDPIPEKEPCPKSPDQKDAIIWSNHPSAPGNFQSPTSDSAYTFPLGSPCSNSSLSSGISGGSKFQSSSASPASSPHSPAAGCTTATSTTLLWCPKGSPVSGYDTASTYSDSSEHRFGATQAQHHHHHHPLSAFESRTTSTYSLDVKMEALDTRYYHHDLTRVVEDAAATVQPPPRSAFTSNHRPHHEVQRWLMDQQVATIARPGIAVYV